MYHFYEAPATLTAALAKKAEYGAHARVMAGGTDLILELERGVRRAPDGGALGVIDLTRVPGLAEISEDEDSVHLGALVTHNQVVANKLTNAYAFPLTRACWEIGAPQIRNRATVAGNIITASPANDAIVPLMALNATVTVASAARGERTLPLHEFTTGFRQVDLADDEILTRVSIPKLGARERGTFIKLGLRRAQAISVVSVAVIIEMDDEGDQLTGARIALGAVAPVIVRATGAEEFLVGKRLTDDVIAEAGCLVLNTATPIDDMRASADYRRAMVETLTVRALRQLRDGNERVGWSDDPVLLWGDRDGSWPAPDHLDSHAPATVNGQAVTLAEGMTLLDSLRAAGFIGVKEGCAEGECGACTAFLDGIAIMACMTPSERAAGSDVVTVEGLGDPAHLQPVQQALIDAGGVQCGYCTPGFVMSAAKLLEERPRPTRAEAAAAVTGNFCRCTGYRKIIDAVILASNQQAGMETVVE